MADASPATALTTQPDDIRPATLFRHHDAHPLVLDAVIVTAFGKDWWEWVPEAVWDGIKRYFGQALLGGGQLEISELNRNKIMAVKTLHATDACWISWDAFVPTIQALNNNIPRFDIIQQPSFDALAAGVDMMESVDGRKFSDEVARFVAAAALSDGVWFLPPPLDFAQRLAARPMYRCTSCGNEDEDDLEDDTCDVCAKRFRGEHNLDGKPTADSPAKKLGHGKVERYFINDYRPVKERYESVAGKGLDQVDLGETQVDRCVARVLRAREYMKLRRRQLAQQMEMMRPWLLAP